MINLELNIGFISLGVCPKWNMFLYCEELLTTSWPNSNREIR